MPESPIDDSDEPWAAPVDRRPLDQLSELERRLPDARERDLVTGVLKAELLHLNRALTELREANPELKDDGTRKRSCCRFFSWSAP